LRPPAPLAINPSPEKALAAIAPLANDSKLRDYYVLLAVRRHLLLELGWRAEAAAASRASLECPCSEPERRFLQRKPRECGLPG
jgi:RNA polymerase sigma-70 factor (ECF subfamily)